MRRGSTPTFVCRLPAAANHFSEIELVFVQDGKELLTVDKGRMTSEKDEVSFTMTEEETMTFAPSVLSELQLRLVDLDGAVWVSDIRTVTVRKKYPEDAV
ncbi:MAG: hypothetical protein IJD10_02475 [Clostridia bacterium]|nr:hypothetical protein [Clostridia bacterium]